MVVDTTPTYDAQPPSRCEEMLNNKLNQFSKYDREGTACHYCVDIRQAVSLEASERLTLSPFCLVGLSKHF